MQKFKYSFLGIFNRELGEGEVQTTTINAVREKDVPKYLELIRKHSHTEENFCEFCGTEITEKNFLGTVPSYNKKIAVFCDNPLCLSKAIYQKRENNGNGSVD